MKKNIIKSLVLATLIGTAGLLSSCNDALDIEQPGEINESVIFTSVANLEKYLVGDVYTVADPSNEIYLSAVLSDEVKPGFRSGGQEFELHRLFVNPNETYLGNIWLQHYKLINRVNRLLAGEEIITPQASEVAAYNKAIAEARALRAWSYVQLSAFYSTDMKNPEALGVILVNDVPNTQAKLPRSKNSEIFNLIIEDLNFAAANLQRGTTRFKVDIDFVNAVRARFYLYTGKYDLAKQYANEVVTNSGLSLTVATPGTQNDLEVGSTAWNTAFYGVASSFNPYQNMWNDSQQGEIVTAFQRIGSGPSGNIGSFWNTNSSQYNGVPMWVWGRNLFNIFYNTEGDIRRYTYVDPTALINPDYLTSPSPITTDVLVINKYPGKTSYPVKNDIKVFRLSEMYFILAEAEAQANNLTKAREYVHAVREARNYLGLASTPTYTSKEIALRDILKERRVELALEGHRYIDLKRLAADAGVTMDRNKTDDIVEVFNLPNGDYRYTLPIPLSETSANTNAQQNPGY